LIGAKEDFGALAVDTQLDNNPFGSPVPHPQLYPQIFVPGALPD